MESLKRTAADMAVSLGLCRRNVYALIAKARCGASWKTGARLSGLITEVGGGVRTRGSFCHRFVTTPLGSRAGGFWNDAGVSSHTDRSVHAQKRDTLKATSVSHGTTDELGSIFTPVPAPGNPPKCYLVANVQRNYLSLLFVKRKVEIPVLPSGSTAFIPVHECGAFRRELVNVLQNEKTSRWHCWYFSSLFDCCAGRLIAPPERVSSAQMIPYVRVLMQLL